MMIPMTDLNAQVKSWPAGATQDASGDPKIITAGATEDGVKITGETIDLGNDLDRPESGILEACGIASLAATETLSLAAELQESSDGASWDTAEALYTATVVATGVTGGSTGLGWAKQTHVKIKARKRYIRFNVTPTMSASGTDTSVGGWSFVGGSGRRVPTA